MSFESPLEALIALGISRGDAERALEESENDFDRAFISLTTSNCQSPLEEEESDSRCLNASGSTDGEDIRKDVPPEQKNSVLELRVMAEKGDPDAQFRYGLCLFDGDGVPQNLTEAARYFKMAADQGNLDGKAKYGVCLLQGLGVVQNQAKGVLLVKNAAEQGQKDAQRKWGVCLLNGVGVSRDMEQGARYIKLAADQGEKLAQFYYGRILSGDFGSPTDMKESARYFKLSADQEVADAQARYGVCLLLGLGVQQDQEKGAHYIKMAADQGVSLAQYNYGCCLLRGTGVQKDQTEAVRYFKMAAEQGMADAQYEYAVALFYGDGVAENKTEAVRYFKMAAEQGMAEAQYEYAMALFYGDSVAENKTEAVRYFKMAADQGMADAQYEYAMALFYGDSVAENKTEAVRYFKMAAEQGMADAQRIYGFFLLQGVGVQKNQGEAIRYIRLAADKGDRIAQHNYGVSLLHGNGVEKNESEAARYFKLAAAQGLSVSQLNYGLCLLRGIGVPTNEKEALVYLKNAADQGVVDGQMLYGYCLIKGWGTSPDIKTALQYLRKAADQGDSNAQSVYATYLLEYIDLCQDKAASLQLLEQWAKQGNTYVQCQFGLCCFGMYGFRQSSQKAAFWVKRAADAMNPTAQAIYGIFLWYGKCVPWDPKEGAKYLEMAAERNVHLGQYCYAAYLLEKHLGTVNQDPRILKYLTKLSRIYGDAMNLCTLITSSFTGSFDHEGFLYHMTKACSLKCLCAQYNMAAYLLWQEKDKENEREYNEENFLKAIELFAVVARQGSDSDSDFDYKVVLKKLGSCSHDRWVYIKAEADQGHCEAQFMYGKYLYSKSTPESLELALKYFLESANQEHPDACFAYGAISLHDKHRPWKECAPYYEKAAQLGFLEAQYHYGLRLAKEHVLKHLRFRNLLRSARFLKKAAQEVLLRRESKKIRVTNNALKFYPKFMYSPIPDKWVLKANENFIIEHFSRTFGQMSQMKVIMPPPPIAIQYRGSTERRELMR